MGGALLCRESLLTKAAYNIIISGGLAISSNEMACPLTNRNFLNFIT